MALDGAYEHRKTRRLARALNVQPWAALGLLEVFWRWCRRSAKTGRIDRDQWDDVADFVQWHQPSEQLRATLIEQRFVDEMDGWDWVHDWHHHADNTTRHYLHRRGEYFANGADARIPLGGYRDRVSTNDADVQDRLSTKEGFVKDPVSTKRPNVETNSQNVETTARARPEPEPEPEPEPINLHHHHQRAREAEPFDGPDPSALVAEAVEAVAAVWPSTRRGDVKYARSRWEREAASHAGGVAAWCERIRRDGPIHAEAHRVCAQVDGRHFIPNLERWVDSGDYARTPPTPPAVSSQQRRKETQAEQILAKVAAKLEKPRAN